jgi:RES domain-containing protein
MCSTTSTLSTPAFTPERVPYRGRLYRALNPVYAHEPLSGRGAGLYGGRFNPKGLPALYASLSAMTALREVNQVGNLQPTTLISYEADIDRVFDCRDEHALKAQDMDAAALADCTWRDQMKAGGEARTQAFARRLIAAGYHALLVRSFAPGATEDDMNLVLWAWGDAAPARLILIDDENRLSRRSLSMMPSPPNER